MVELDRIKQELAASEKSMAQIEKSLDPESIKQRIEETEKLMEEPSFWDDVEKSKKTMSKLKSMKDELEGFQALESGK